MRSPLLKHLLSSHISPRSRRYASSCRCTPNSRLFIMHCHRAGSFPSYPSLNNPPAHVTPPRLSSADAPAGPTSHCSAPISINSNEAGSSFLNVPNSAAWPPCPGATPKQKMAGMPSGMDGWVEEWTDRQASRHTRGHVISV